MGQSIDMERVVSTLEKVGFLFRGGFHPRLEDQVPRPPNGQAPGTVILAGNAGYTMWAAFRQARVTRSRPHPLNNWTRRVLTTVAEECDAYAVFPFDGPPHLPFQRWAQRAEPVVPSPIGMLIHPVYGLWHAYRGALIFAEQLDLPSVADTASLCETCAEIPCLSACPVHAFTPGHFDVAACLRHIASEAGTACLHGGCLARRACPAGQEFIYCSEQARFHMEAFLQNARP